MTHRNERTASSELREQLMAHADENMPPSDASFVEEGSHLYWPDQGRYARFFSLAGPDGTGVHVVVTDSLESLGREFRRCQHEAQAFGGTVRPLDFEQSKWLRAGGAAAYPV